MRQADIAGSQIRNVVPYILLTRSIFACRSAIVGMIQTSWITRPSSTQEKCTSPFMFCEERFIVLYLSTSSSQLPTSHPYTSSDSEISGDRSEATSDETKFSYAGLFEVMMHLVRNLPCWSLASRRWRNDSIQSRIHRKLTIMLGVMFYEHDGHLCHLWS